MKLDFSLDFIHYHLPVQLFIKFSTGGTLTFLVHAYKAWGGGRFLRCGTLQKLHKAKDQKTCHRVPTTSVQYRLKCKIGTLNFFRFHFSLLIWFRSFQSFKFQIYSIKVFLSTFVKNFWKKNGKCFSNINWNFFNLKNLNKI